MEADAIRTTLAMGVAAAVLAAGFVVSQRAVSTETARSVADAQQAHDRARTDSSR
ncbi:hypothetical protein IU449_01615 [Nocardia higoensis]|uniref:Uncharacterized protein n=1 Tax=Nocardia higoensis TaxID=228599 RepID=A0ABS0D438_9NOCA|nr:hypothetical protein [Nocardia higoensis]MBF6353258.1 hypothetical protein [Nocardia higoensis]